jgi:aryl-alcohol dehydrogenase-like predicted oxidoreductase
VEYVTYGKTGLRVSKIALGTWQLGGDWGSFDRSQAIAAIRTARDEGITLFDSAQGYGFGASEEILGEALRPELTSNRDEVVIATKGGLRSVEGGVVRDASPAFLRSGVEDSLRFLGVDTIDVYQVHWPDAEVPFAETAGALGEMVDEGKIRHIGVSNFDVAQMDEFSETRPVESLQPPYHMFRRGVEAEILPYCERENIGVMVYGSLSHGLLTGALTEDTVFPDDDWRAANAGFRGDGYRRNIQVVDRLRGVAADVGCTLSQLALAWILSNTAVHAAIVGSRTGSHIAEAAAAPSFTVSDDVRARIDEILADSVPVAGATPESI